MWEVLYEISYSNLILLGATLPTYGSSKSEDGDALKADEMSEAEMMNWMKDANARMR